MTKEKIIEAIINDMVKKSGDSKAEVEGRWKSWLARQKKEILETVYKNRFGEA